MNVFVVSGLAALVLGYLCGNFLSGYMIGKMAKVDLRKQGSGNIGMTNTLRILGLGAGVITLLLDIIKVIIAVLLVHIIFGARLGFSPEMVNLLSMFAAFGAVMGHDFPLYMHFNGGKGAASSVGVILACFPQTFPLVAIVFFAVVIKTRYVSLGSMIASVVFFLQVMILGLSGHLYRYQNQFGWALLISGLIMVFIMIRHRSNIQRLRMGQENPISLGEKE